MADRVKHIFWSPEAESDLDDIYEYYAEHSKGNELKNILSIIDEAESLVFNKQWQVDECDSSCRRIIVKSKFRVVYKVIRNEIMITAVYPTKKNPENFRKS